MPDTLLIWIVPLLASMDVSVQTVLEISAAATPLTLWLIHLSNRVSTLEARLGYIDKRNVGADEKIQEFEEARRDISVIKERLKIH